MSSSILLQKEIVGIEKRCSIIICVVLGHTSVQNALNMGTHQELHSCKQ